MGGEGDVRTNTHAHSWRHVIYQAERNCQHKTLTRVFPVEMFAINSVCETGSEAFRGH